MFAERHLVGRYLYVHSSYEWVNDSTLEAREPRQTLEECDTQTAPLVLDVDLARSPVLASHSAAVRPLAAAPLVPGGTVTSEVSR